MLVLLTSAAFGAPKDPEAPGNVALMAAPSGFKLFYKSEFAADVKVTIFDEHRKIVYQEVIRAIDSFVRPYNLRNLGEGDYTVEIDGAEGKQVERIFFGAAVPDLAVRLVPVYGVEGKFILSVPRNGRSRLNVTIFGADDERLFSETTHTGDDFARVYDLRSYGKDVVFRVTDSHGNLAIVQPH